MVQSVRRTAVCCSQRSAHRLVSEAKAPGCELLSARHRAILGDVFTLYTHRMVNCYAGGIGKKSRKIPANNVVSVNQVTIIANTRTIMCCFLSLGKTR